ncbi:secreted protein, partial [gut metagenome]
MKKLLTVFVICLALGVTAMDADAARRFGGGASFGRSAPTFSQKAPAPQAVPRTPQQQNMGTQQQQPKSAKPAAQPAKPSM